MHKFKHDYMPGIVTGISYTAIVVTLALIDIFILKGN